MVEWPEEASVASLKAKFKGNYFQNLENYQSIFWILSNESGCRAIGISPESVWPSRKCKANIILISDSNIIPNIPPASII